GEVVGAGLQRVDHAVGEVLARGDDVQVCRQRLGVGSQRGDGRFHIGRVRGDVRGRLPVAAGSRQAKPGGAGQEADHAQLGGGVLVEVYGQGVGRAQQIQTAVTRV